MSTSPSDIDQIIVKKLGGYNLQTVKWWQGLAPDQQQQLLTGGAVQFFAGATEVAPAEAAALLGPAPSAAPAPARAPEPAPQPPVTLAWPSGPDLVHATYTRQVVAGPRWEVTRTRDGGDPVQFHVVRGYPDDSVYDLTDSDGGRRLSEDLFIDAFGIDSDMLPQLTTALRHFKTSVFDGFLGNRPWRTTADEIRATAESNPYLRMLAPSGGQPAI